MVFILREGLLVTESEFRGAKSEFRGAKNVQCRPKVGVFGVLKVHFGVSIVRSGVSKFFWWCHNRFSWWKKALFNAPKAFFRRTSVFWGDKSLVGVPLCFSRTEKCLVVVKVFS